MIYTRCSRCREKIPVGTSCPCYDRGRDRWGRLDVDSFYHSAEWGAARARAIRRTYGLDIVAFYERSEIVTGFTVHHITPLEMGWDLRTEPDNLIYLTEQDHRIIHERYLKDYEQTARYLRELIARFDSEFGKFRRR
ncbi:MAG: HNH endonuclease [Ruminococcus sp.]|nr:HNH endonuclease [Ruminococcus sp.]